MLSNGECFLLTHANFRFPAFPTRIVKRTIDWIGAIHPTHLQISEFPVPSNTPGFRRFRTILAQKNIYFHTLDIFRPPPPYMVWKEKKSPATFVLPMPWCEIELLGIFICEKIAPTCLSMELVDSIHSPVNKIAPSPPLSLVQPESS